MVGADAGAKCRFGSGFSLDVGRRELAQGGALVSVEPQVFDLLLFLVENRDRVVSKDDLLEAVWGGRIVSESTLTSRINAARRAVGDTGARQEMIRTVARKGFRFVAAVTEPGPRAAAPDPVPTAAALRQEVQFTTAADGTRIAYAAVGDGPPLVKAANWLNHLEYDWESPIWKHFFTAMAADRRLIRYDARGNGRRWDVTDFSFEDLGQRPQCVVEEEVSIELRCSASRGLRHVDRYAVRHRARRISCTAATRAAGASRARRRSSARWRRWRF